MNLKKALKFGMLACTAAAVAAEVATEEEDDVLVLTAENLEDTIMNYDNLLVEFYAPWCGHCKALAPEYSKAAAKLKALDPPLRLAKVDASNQHKVFEQFKIQGFPTMKLFRKSLEQNDIVEFNAGRNADAIEKWMIKKTGPAVQIVESQEEIDKLAEANDVVVVAYLDAVDGDNKQLLEKVAGVDESNVYVATANKELAEAKGKTVPGLTLLKSFDEGNQEFDLDFTASNIKTFVKENSQPLVQVFSQEKSSQIFGGEIDVHVLMFADTEQDYYNDFVSNAKDAAKENKGKLMHIVIPLSEDRILDFFGLKEADLPAVMLVNMGSGMKKFSYATKGEELKATLTSSFAADLSAFEKSYFSGDLKPTLKSSDPVDDKDEAVKVIVGKDFKERVVDADKDVLLEFYAPWCGHCKTLAPKYEELAEKFAGVESIMIAKMDATENEVDHPGVDVQGFPTIIFFPAGDKENPIQFDGEREVKGMTEFLQQHARKFELDGESHGKDEL